MAKNTGRGSRAAATSTYGRRRFTTVDGTSWQWHRPRPGPHYWDWRCLLCSNPVDEHRPWFQRLMRRWRSRG